MMSSHSIFTEFKKSYVIFALIAWVMVVAGIATAIQLEKSYWYGSIAEEYKDQSQYLLEEEFKKLKLSARAKSTKRSIEQISRVEEPNYVIDQIEKEHGYHASALLVQDQFGKVIHGESIVDNFVLTKVSPLHESIDNLMFSPQSNVGVNFVDGRIFFFASEVMKSVDNQTWVVTLMKEANNQMFKEFSQKMGQSFELNYRVAGHRVSQISYKDGYKFNLYEVEEKHNKLYVTYNITLTSGRLQTAKFSIVVSLPQYAYINPYWLILVFGLVIPGCFVGFWFSVKLRIVEPSLGIIEKITADKHFDLETEKDEELEGLPLELDFLHQRFTSVYEYMAEQNNFSNLLVDAIGDVIITIDKAGKITYANPAAEVWLGFSEMRLIGQPVELYLNNLDDASPNAEQWVYRSNLQHERIQIRCLLSSLGQPGKAYLSDVICQPLAFKDTGKNWSSSVIVVRIKETIESDPYNPAFSIAKVANLVRK